MKVIVNLITFIRLLCTFFIPLMWVSLPPFVVIGIVAFILLTDAVDGILARLCHVQSLLGAVMDTIADKAFGMVVIFVIGKYYPSFYYLLAAEIGIALINMTTFILGGNVSSRFLGKQKMWPLGISIVFSVMAILSNTYENFKILPLLVGITLIFEILALIDYLGNLWREIRGKKMEFNYVLKEPKTLRHVLWDTEYYLQNRDCPLRQQLFEKIKK